ncbi:MAG: hypothetical protein KDK12_02960 [Rhodobacteraceae bacterium]|nr:hypothetical protein [Paracoccaceae bacterium]
MNWASGEDWSNGDGGRWRRTVCCRACGGPATAWPTLARSVRDEDRAHFEGLADFVLIPEPWGGVSALYRPQSGVRALDEIPLPAGYDPRDWSPRWRGGTAGPLSEYSVLCDRCGLREVRAVSWPADAFFQIEHRGHVLWAWDRETALVLCDYVAGADRRLGYTDPNLAFLKRVPSAFLTAKAREPVVRKLRRRLAEATG